MEFDIIARYFEPLGRNIQAPDLAIGDDGALWTPPAQSQCVVVTDTLVADVHFFAHADPYAIAWKALAVNLSDLAAMGAAPAFYSLALTLPNFDQAWLTRFAQGLDACAQYHAKLMSNALNQPVTLPLVGGDTTRGPLCITVSAQGWLPQGTALLRSGARVGDDIYVSGQIGEAGLGLSLARENPHWIQQNFHHNLSSLPSQQQQALLRLQQPCARVDLGFELRSLAHAAIDISDGLLADLQHILQASQCGAELEPVEVSQAVTDWTQGDELKALQAGDDYELCFTAAVSQRQAVQNLAEQFNLELRRIGKISANKELRYCGKPLALQQAKGYQHF